jgi:hypothetical protein
LFQLIPWHLLGTDGHLQKELMVDRRREKPRSSLIITTPMEDSDKHFASWNCQQGLQAHPAPSVISTRITTGPIASGHRKVLHIVQKDASLTMGHLWPDIT